MNEYITSISNTANANLANVFVDLATAVTGCLVIVFIIFGVFKVKDVIDLVGNRKSETGTGESHD
jgi:hypothetical protein